MRGACACRMCVPQVSAACACRMCAPHVRAACACRNRVPHVRAACACHMCLAAGPSQAYTGVSDGLEQKITLHAHATCEAIWSRGIGRCTGHLSRGEPVTQPLKNEVFSLSPCSETGVLGSETSVLDLSNLVLACFDSENCCFRSPKRVLGPKLGVLES